MAETNGNGGHPEPETSMPLAPVNVTFSRDTARPMYPCSAAIRELRDSLAKEISDEAAAAKKYNEASVIFAANNMPGFSNLLGGMSMDEQNHHSFIEAIIKDLDDACKER